MLNLIQSHVGGRVRTSWNQKPFSAVGQAHKGLPLDGSAFNIIPTDAFVLWVVDSRQSFRRILRFFDVYPPQTTRLRAQLRFALLCLEHDDVVWYLSARDSKYLDCANEITPDLATFFPEWLSGFIEAQGCFCIRINGSCSFSIGHKVAGGLTFGPPKGGSRGLTFIGQNADFFLLEKIRNYFGVQSRTRNVKQSNTHTFFSFETYRISSLHQLVEHFNKYPLLGDKLISFHKFKDQIV